MISNIARIAEELSVASEFDVAIRGLAMGVCTSGATARCFLGQTREELSVEHVASVGFPTSFASYPEYGALVSDWLPGRNKDQLNLMIKSHTRSYQEHYRRAIGVKDNPNWRTTVSFRLPSAYFVVITTATEVVDHDESLEYFSIIQSMLVMFLRSYEAKPGDPKRASLDLKSKSDSDELSERQSVILEMIQAGDTNLTIALRMGYSESLIRQESVLIYRKLGIKGRVDLGVTNDERQRKKAETKHE